MKENFSKKQNKKTNLQDVQTDHMITLKLQFVLTFVTCLLLLVFVFYKDIKCWVEILLGLDLFILAINNQKYYKRKIATWLYLICGIAVIVLAILEMSGIL